MPAYVAPRLAWHEFRRAATQAERGLANPLQAALNGVAGSIYGADIVHAITTGETRMIYGNVRNTR
jgi:hypothetical protein